MLILPVKEILFNGMGQKAKNNYVIYPVLRKKKSSKNNLMNFSSLISNQNIKI